MEAIEALMTRRSIRKYTDRPVPGQVVEQLLRAAMAAPSAGNQQPWHFVVIRDRTSLESVSKELTYGVMARDAQLAVLICGGVGDERHPGFWVQDCSAATQNLLIAAHALGLGAVWLGIYPREERVALLRSLCMVPDYVVPFALVAVGYPAEQPGPADRFEQARVHLDTWEENR
jgi:nitroreductase